MAGEAQYQPLELTEDELFDKFNEIPPATPA